MPNSKRKIELASTTAAFERYGVCPKKMPEELRNRFLMDGKVHFEEWYIDESNPTGGHLVFRRKEIEDLKMLAAWRMWRCYEFTDLWLHMALTDFPIAEKDVVIIGSEGPWFEAVCMERGASVTTIEYRRILTDMPGYVTMTPDEFALNPRTFDAAVSISSIEHDGLGRYGDPVNPDADIETMRRYKEILRPGGLLYFSAPVGRDVVVWNAHRIYGRHRLPLMFEGWELVRTYGFTPELLDHQTIGQEVGRNYTQPVFVLSNIA